MKFLIDTQLPPKLKGHLKEFGYDANHTHSDFPDGHLMPDAQIREIAVNESYIIITKDRDFLDHYHLKGVPPRVLLLTLGNISNYQLLNYFSMYFEKIADQYVGGAELIIAGTDRIVVFK